MSCFNISEIPSQTVNEIRLPFVPWPVVQPGRQLATLLVQRVHHQTEGIEAATITADGILSGTITGDKIATATIEGCSIKAGTKSILLTTRDVLYSATCDRDLLKE